MIRRLRMLVPVVVIVLIAAGCTSSDDDGNGSGDTGGGASGALENTGNVNLLSAGEPEEADAYQEIFDELINAETDYKVEVESVGDFEEQFQIRAEGGTLDVAAVPQPGAIPDLVEPGLDRRRSRTSGFDIDELERPRSASRSWRSASTRASTTACPTNINLKSMVWYPKDDFDAAGYEVPTTWDELIALSDQIVDDGSTPWCVGFESEGATGWPATDWMEDIMLRTAGPDVYDQWVAHEIPFNDPAVEDGRARCSARSCSPTATSSAAPTHTPDIAFGDAPLPDVRRPAEVLAAPPGELHQRLLPGGRRWPASTTTGSRCPPIDQEGILYAGELTVVGKNGNRPEVVDFLKRFIAEDVQCEMGGVAASSRISPNVDVGPGLLRQRHPGRRLGGPDRRRSTEGTGRFDASDLMPAAVGQRQLLDRDDRVRAGRPGLARRRARRHRGSWPVVAASRRHGEGAADRRPLPATEPEARGDATEPPTPTTAPSRAGRRAPRVLVGARRRVVAVGRCVLLGDVRLPAGRRRQPAPGRRRRHRRRRRRRVLPVLGDEPGRRLAARRGSARASGRTCSSGPALVILSVFLDLPGDQHDPDQLQGRARSQELRRARQLRVRLHRREHAAVDPQHGAAGSSSSRSSR